MAPQLGLGSFRIQDANGDVVGYASSDHSGDCQDPSTEMWALRERNAGTGQADYPWPGASPVTLEFVRIDPNAHLDDAFCQFVDAQPNEDVGDFCVRKHAVTHYDCS